MKAISTIISFKVSQLCKVITERFTKGNGKIMKSTEKESIHGRTATSTEGPIKMGRDKVSESWSTVTDNFTKDIG